MTRLIKPLLVTFVLMVMACNFVTQTFQETQPSIPTQAVPATTAPQMPDMTTAAASATALPVYSPTDTIVPAAATETLEPSNATLAAEMGSMGVLMKNPMPQFLHPVGEPLKSWHDVPVMPQATAGQEFNANVYSYIATASLAQAGQFYSSKAASLGLTTPPATGFGGSGSNAEHDMMFSSFSLTIVLTSFDNDTGHVIAVIAKVP